MSSLIFIGVYRGEYKQQPDQQFKDIFLANFRGKQTTQFSKKPFWTRVEVKERHFFSFNSTHHISKRLTRLGWGF
jgi:hypothetical protein